MYALPRGYPLSRHPLWPRRRSFEGLHPPTGLLRCGCREGERSLSSTLQHQRTPDSEERLGRAEDAPDNNELSRNVLGLIGAYRMGAALDAEDLYPKRKSEAVPATVVAA